MAQSRSYCCERTSLTRFGQIRESQSLPRAWRATALELSGDLAEGTWRVVSIEPPSNRSPARTWQRSRSRLRKDGHGARLRKGPAVLPGTGRRGVGGCRRRECFDVP
jgi:hypothetical protein